MPPISRPASSTYWTPPSNRQRRLSEIPTTGNTNRIYSTTRIADGGDISSSMSTSTSRHYVDPWDLENYAFMKRHCTDGEPDYVATSTPALESSQSDFYYVPQYNKRHPSPRVHPSEDEDALKHFPRYLHDPLLATQDDSIGLVNGVEEEDFYNERYELSAYGNRYSPRTFDNGGCYVDLAPRNKFKPASCLYSRTDAADSYEDYDPCGDDSAGPYSDDSTALASSGGYGRTVYNHPRIQCQLYSPSVMLRRAPSRDSDQSLVYVYETGSRNRKVTLPKDNMGLRRTSVPAPTTILRRHSTNSHHLANNYRARRVIHGRVSCDSYPSEMGELRHLRDIDTPYVMASYDDLNHPYYDIYCTKPLPVTPHHFGLSKYGHLKIDYSFSWNSLDRYIATE